MGWDAVVPVYARLYACTLFWKRDKNIVGAFPSDMLGAHISPTAPVATVGWWIALFVKSDEVDAAEADVGSAVADEADEVGGGGNQIADEEDANDDDEDDEEDPDAAENDDEDDEDEDEDEEKKKRMKLVQRALLPSSSLSPLPLPPVLRLTKHSS